LIWKQRRRNNTDEKTAELKPYYFTYSDEGQDHDGGHVVVWATDYYRARQIYAETYTTRRDGFLRFAFQYSKEDWDSVKYGHGFNEKCHREINKPQEDK
jgi:hypothetical protein